VRELTREITIAATPAAIYAFASATERWPEILPHYRRVRVLAQHGSVRVVEMIAWRDIIPIAWVAEQTNDPTRPAIRFRHVRGVTRGMDVEWRFVPVPGGTRLTIAHHLSFASTLGNVLGERVVGTFLVDNVARKTLARMKAVAEGNVSA
jgi:ribosome-associated toxin RatA of RatAB toxin-antitoxin module